MRSRRKCRFALSPGPAVLAGRPTLSAPAAGSPLRSVRMSDRSRKLAKPAAAFGLLATMASIWWFALRPRRKIKLDDSKE